MDNNYGKSTSKVDNKGRISIPSMYFFKPGDEVVFLEGNNNRYYMYLLERLDSLIDSLKEKEYNCTNQEQLNFVKEEIKSVLNAIDSRVKVHSQRRVIVPESLKGCEQVFLLGNYDSILLFPSEDNYKEYSKSRAPFIEK